MIKCFKNIFKTLSILILLKYKLKIYSCGGLKWLKI